MPIDPTGETLKGLADFLLDDRIISLRDSEGRPVSEPTSPGEGLVSCPYQDARYGQPMNLPALRQLTSHWNHTLDWVSSEATTTSSLRDSLAVALWATVEPALFHLANPEVTIPVELSVRYKACIGYCQVLFVLIWNDSDPDSAFLSDFGSSREFVHWLDSEEWLLGQHQVCPGPNAMIEELFERFCYARLAPENRVYVEEVLCLVALQSVHLLGSHSTMGELATKLMQSGHAPWIFSIHQKPDRDPEEVRKLFAGGILPLRVEQMLESPASEELFRTLWAG